MKKRNIILLSSPAPRMGKDTVGSFLVDNFSYQRIALADWLKKIAIQLGWNKQKDEKGRKFLIDLGMAVRGYNKDGWCELIKEEILESTKDIVITDIRFKNEYDFIRSIDGLNVISIGIESDKYGDISLVNDVSQIEYKNIPKDYIIKNNFNLEYMYCKIDAILKSI